MNSNNFHIIPKQREKWCRSYHKNLIPRPKPHSKVTKCKRPLAWEECFLSSKGIYNVSHLVMVVTVHLSFSATSTIFWLYLHQAKRFAYHHLGLFHSGEAPRKLAKMRSNGAKDNDLSQCDFALTFCDDLRSSMIQGIILCNLS